MSRERSSSQPSHFNGNDICERQISAVSTESKEDGPRWGNRRQFILSCIGYTVGLGNFWRFPWLVKEYGGGAFLIAYILFFVLVGVPVVYLELAVGRLMRTHTIQTWKKVSNYAAGIGMTSILVSFMICTYYIVVVAWCFLYFISSFQYPLPWSSCPMETSGNVSRMNIECNISDPVTYHWFRIKLDISESISEGWTLHGGVTISYVFIWVVLILSLYKGIESAGKVVYFTAIFPYVALVILLLRGFFLEGAIDVGLHHFITPKWSVLLEVDTWYNAVTQIIYSMGISLGVWVTYSSFCPPEQNILTDTLIISFADIGSSILGALVIFQILGFRATRKFEECMSVGSGKRLNKHGNHPSNRSQCSKEYFMGQASSGSGLAFIAFSESIIHLPGSPFFSVMFFLLLVALGTDSMFGMIEVIVSALRMNVRLRKMAKAIPLFLVCAPLFLIGFTMTTRAGSYVMDIILVYGTDFPLLIVAVCEVMALSYIYGVNKFTKKLEKTNKQKLQGFFKISWRIISPVIIICVVGLRIYTYISTQNVFTAWNGALGKTIEIPYTLWSTTMSILLCICALLPLPLGVIYGVREQYRIKCNSLELQEISV
ncbi:sodium-dependent neutral amino acid transporter B(0)AT2-like isoform X1 [Hydractinia symbiolongicarpus]|uniref:sodium-dependent neutral amino acid transporter B(0)AT2-like isoform X1 n=1 Tax=Hydractinia symbiolongicarpus TaxID=13093 RepID=UPI00254C286C|nr:sodium-dependent neutral amino acid transporter B(0)AT2-like isoform X1 [Hydractinia symbiolongicarpus]